MQSLSKPRRYFCGCVSCLKINSMSKPFTARQTKLIKGIAYFFLSLGLIGLMGYFSQDLFGYSWGIPGPPAPLLMMAFCGAALLWMVYRKENEEKNNMDS